MRPFEYGCAARIDIGQPRSDDKQPPLAAHKPPLSSTTCGSPDNHDELAFLTVISFSGR
jgi:hypothetical protein